jgi:hypothetical protein
MRQGRDAPPLAILIRALLTSFIVGLSWPAGASGAPRSGVDQAKAVAQKVYAQGVDHYRAGRLLEALAAFRASYAMVRSPNSHLMIARALRDHGSLVDAYLEYGEVVAEADSASAEDPKYDKASQDARAERASLRERLTMVTVQVNEPPDDLRIAVGDRTVDKARWGEAVPVSSGAIVARATSAGRPEQRRELAAVPGGDLVVRFDFGRSLVSAPQAVPVGIDGASSETLGAASAFPRGDAIPDIPRQPARAPPPTKDRTWAYVSFGLGAAGLATFVTFGAIDQAAFNDLQRKCPGGHCGPDAAADVDRGRQAQTIANVGLGVALVGGTLGSIILVSTRAPEERTEEVARRPGRVTLTDLTIAPHSVQVGGAF